MAGNKIFYVTRTETEGQPAGAATLHRGDKPQLLKIVGVDHAGNPDPATPEDNQIYATEEENQEILFTSDTVQEGDLNPVTSDAVATYVKNQNILSDFEVITIPTSSAAAITIPYDGFVTLSYAATTANGQLKAICIRNGVTVVLYSGANPATQALAATFPVQKDDKLYADTSNGGSLYGTSYAQYYKLRDYSDRS